MPAFLADENFERDIVRGLHRRGPHIDIIRVQDVGLRQTDDRIILEWAAERGLVLLTHDRKTMPDLAYERLRLGQKMPGVLVVSTALSIGQVIEEIYLVIECTLDAEWEGQVRHLPL